jgi:serpin B
MNVTDMKRFWKYGAMVAFVLMSTLLSFAKDSAPIAPQGRIADGNNDFACNLLRAIYEQQQGGGSFIMSPISVSYMLGMLNAGAEGETQRQITDVLGLDVSAQEINQHFKKIMNEASSVDSTVTIKIANSIDVNSARNYCLIPKYKTDMHEYYKAQIDAFDFGNSRNVDIINNWCNIHTDGMIPKILDRLDPGAAMCLLNAVYFKASWTNEFDPKNTRDKIFTKQDGTMLEHKMMHVSIKGVAYGSNNLCKMLSLPYGNGNYSMIVLLPHEGKTISDIIQSLSAQQLERQRTQEMTIHNVDILMPRFTTENEIGLEQVLSSMGMPLAFHPRAAEFSNMVKGEELWVSMMKQKAKIEVNEKGTKAAAVTVTMMTTKSMNPNRTIWKEFHATRPFVYYIVDNSSGTIYFMGTYCGEEGAAIPTQVTIDIDSIGSNDAVVVLPEVMIKSYGGVGENRPLPELTINHRGYGVEQKPQFPGGDAALMKYLRSHINYPPMAFENDIEGRVIVQFLVDKTTGKVGEVKVVRSVDKYLDKEAIRVVKSLPIFTPGRHKGKPVDVWYVLPVTFVM